MNVSTSSLPLTLAFLSIFILAFFPSPFNSLLQLPLALLSLPISVLYPTHAPSPSPSPSPIATNTATGFLSPPPTSSSPAMFFFQKQFTLPPHSRGSYLVTDDVRAALPEISQFRVGILHLFVQHTSCALSLNENWDEDVRADMSDALDRIVPEEEGGGRGKRGGVLYRHSAEGSDDMPAHVKSALIGASVTIPITDGKLATGTWQGIWYLEFRTARHARRVVATIQGEKAG